MTNRLKEHSGQAGSHDGSVHPLRPFGEQIKGKQPQPSDRIVASDTRGLAPIAGQAKAHPADTGLIPQRFERPIMGS